MSREWEREGEGKGEGGGGGGTDINYETSHSRAVQRFPESFSGQNETREVT